jgi:hypothetical protein
MIHNVHLAIDSDIVRFVKRTLCKVWIGRIIRSLVVVGKLIWKSVSKF